MVFFPTAVEFSLHMKCGYYRFPILYELNFSDVLFSAREFYFSYICWTCSIIALFGFLDSVSLIYVSFHWIFLGLRLVGLTGEWGKSLSGFSELSIVKILLLLLW